MQKTESLFHRTSVTIRCLCPKEAQAFTAGHGLPLTVRPVGAYSDSEIPALQTAVEAEALLGAYGQTQGKDATGRTPTNWFIQRLMDVSHEVPSQFLAGSGFCVPFDQVPRTNPDGGDKTKFEFVRATNGKNTTQCATLTVARSASLDCTYAASFSWSTVAPSHLSKIKSLKVSKGEVPLRFRPRIIPPASAGTWGIRYSLWPGSMDCGCSISCALYGTCLTPKSVPDSDTLENSFVGMLFPSAGLDPSAQHKPGTCAKTYREERCPAQRRLGCPIQAESPKRSPSKCAPEIGGGFGIATKGFQNHFVRVV
ncbi:hypothetical protein C8R44DRAFT_753178 [Mycena epipterygia]|nr:hypothetical protein C8R44DRAFT_753178 [Mycena epipterygia]